MFHLCTSVRFQYRVMNLEYCVHNFTQVYPTVFFAFTSCNCPVKYTVSAFLDCYLGCPSCPVNAFQIGQAVWVVIWKYSLYFSNPVIPTMNTFLNIVRFCVSATNDKLLLQGFYREYGGTGTTTQGGGEYNLTPTPSHTQQQQQRQDNCAQKQQQQDYQKRQQHYHDARFKMQPEPQIPPPHLNINPITVAPENGSEDSELEMPESGLSDALERKSMTGNNSTNDKSVPSLPSALTNYSTVTGTTTHIPGIITPGMAQSSSGIPGITGSDTLGKYRATFSQNMDGML